MPIVTTPTAYHIDGKVYPRVTSILALVRDLSSIPPDVLERAAARGNAVHRACWILEADPSGLAWDTVHPDVVPYVRAFEDAKRVLRWQTLEAERLVVSTRYGYAGRADLVVTGITGAHVTVLDLKSGVAHPSHALQLAAYVEAYREMTGTKRSVGRRILYLSGEGRYRLEDVPAARQQADFNVFLACLAVYRWRAQQGDV